MCELKCCGRYKRCLTRRPIALTRVDARELVPPTMTSFEAFREFTGWKRPGRDHGCKPVEIVPGLWTAHYRARSPGALRTRAWRPLIRSL